MKGAGLEIAAKVVEGEVLSRDESEELIGEILDGKLDEALAGAVLASMRLRGERAEELVGGAKALLARCVPLEGLEDAFDTCGTGGDRKGTINVSTAVAFVGAAVGIKVVKHGNRAVSSRCGSADLLLALGARLDMSPEELSRCVSNVGFGFVLAPLYHPALGNVSDLRRRLGFRTIFNLLGPLANPARPASQLLGVSEPRLVEAVAKALRELGRRRAMVVHGGGVDEISLWSSNLVLIVDGDREERLLLEAKDFGLGSCDLSEVQGGGPEENARHILDVFEGRRGPMRDVILANASALMVLAGLARDFKEGTAIAAEALDKGLALRKLLDFVSFSRGLGR